MKLFLNFFFVRVSKLFHRVTHHISDVKHKYTRPEISNRSCVAIDQSHAIS